MGEYRLSLCIPTNGIVEWVVPVIKSIYSQGIDDSLFEVVVCDNGKESKLQDFINEFYIHKNFVYEISNAQMFQNQIACFKLARGNLLKFVNHRMLMEPGSIKYLLDFEEKYNETKPICYFSNQVLKIKDEIILNSFEEFVKSLSYYSSWSAGLCVWKDDFEKIPSNIQFNKMFPHATILFFIRDKKQYVIKNKKILSELDNDATKKGKYNLFQTFAVEYPALLMELVDADNLSLNVYQKVIDDLYNFLVELYSEFVICKTPCSYDLSGADEYLLNLYSLQELTNFKRKAKFNGYKLTFHRFLKKFYGKK